MNTTSQLTDNTLSSNAFFQVNKVMLKYLGSAEAAILLPEFIFSRNLFQSKGQDQEGWWFVTKEYLMNQTGFSEYVILKAEKLLVSKGLLLTKLRGLPRLKYFYINDKKINDILSGYIPVETQVTQPNESQPEELSDVTLNNEVHNQNNSVDVPLNLQVIQPQILVGNNTVLNNNIINKKIENKKIEKNKVNVDELDDSEILYYTNSIKSERIVSYKKLTILYPEIRLNHKLSMYFQRYTEYYVEQQLTNPEYAI